MKSIKHWPVYSVFEKEIEKIRKENEELAATKSELLRLEKLRKVKDIFYYLLYYVIRYRRKVVRKNLKKVLPLLLSSLLLPS